MVELATCYDHISQMFQPTQAYNSIHCTAPLHIHRHTVKTSVTVVFDHLCIAVPCFRMQLEVQLPITLKTRCAIK